MLGDKLFLHFLRELPVIVDIVNNFWRNGDGRVLFIPIVKEELVIEDWSSWFLLAFGKLWWITSGHSLFVLLSGSDLVRMFSVMLFYGLR